MVSANSNKILIITGYFKGESYGLLGPQMAATIINENSGFSSIVAAVTNEDDKQELKNAVNEYFGDAKKIVAFSCLGGRMDLFDFARELKNEGAVTFLAGPQAGVDYKGEIDSLEHPHRFRGFADTFSFALQGPAQQILPVLEAGFDADLSGFDGILFQDENGDLIENKPVEWSDEWLGKVDWKTICRLKNRSFKPFDITCAQILQQIGCPHASKVKQIQIGYPESLDPDHTKPPVTIRHKGCSFCDVATDKGYFGTVGKEAVKSQMACLPGQSDGSRIAFELINESPLPKLSDVMRLAKENAIELSQINLTLRADYFLAGLDKLKAALETAVKENIRLLLGSIGFESFEDTLLSYMNKGVTRQMNLDTIQAIRELKPKYPYHFGYLKEEGANHGFIHPTPWDTPQISAQVNRTIAMYQLAMDILPNHSTPLIIHHASGLADWIRQIEHTENITFERIGTTIAWWQKG